MSDELDRRAALAMGWTVRVEAVIGTSGGTIEYWGGDREERPINAFRPSTDRNDLAELLREVERRGVVATYNVSTRIRDLWSADESVLANQYFFAMTADPAIICEAVCEVLEAANERN